MTRQGYLINFRSLFHKFPKNLKLVVYSILALSILGINQSSINVLDSNNSIEIRNGIYISESSIGPKRFIRSDEFLRSSPSVIAAMQSERDLLQSPLSLDSNLVFGVPSDFYTYIAFPEKLLTFKLLPLFSVNSAFALEWWMPLLLLSFALILLIKLFNLSS